ncbi:thiamine-phosphate kinase [Spirillospora sp. NPDC049652]
MKRDDDLRAVGEKDFLEGLLPRLYADPLLVGGFGHDASVIELPDAPFNLIQKIDRASYPVALKEGWADHGAWGRMAVTANCSDILASGGSPLSCMMAVLVPGTARVRDVRALIAGAAAECRTNGVVYAGGDTKEAADAHVVGTAVGIVAKDGFLPRNAARPGDLVYCAGEVGGFTGAYFLLKRVPPAERERAEQEYIEYLAHPAAQWRTARIVNAAKVAHCGMDASDGILDVLQTFAAGGLGVRLDLPSIPYHRFAVECSRKTGIPLTQFIFGGGDWNILYCVAPSQADRMDELSLQGLPLRRIGEMLPSGGPTARNSDHEFFRLRGVVNEHFKSRIEDASDFMDHIEKGNFLIPADAT